MFKLKIDREPSHLDTVIDRILSELDQLDPASEQYATVVNQLVKLHSMKTHEGPKRVSPDALVAAGASLLGIIIMVNYERVHVFTTRALGILPKPS
jgi:hypothetical protein